MRVATEAEANPAIEAVAAVLRGLAVRLMGPYDDLEAKMRPVQPSHQWSP